MTTKHASTSDNVPETYGTLVGVANCRLDCKGPLHPSVQYDYSKHPCSGSEQRSEACHS